MYFKKKKKYMNICIDRNMCWGGLKKIVKIKYFVLFY